VVEGNERSALIRGRAFGIGRAVGEIFRATLRLVGNPVQRVELVLVVADQRFEGCWR